jgi:hypothetical protein
VFCFVLFLFAICRSADIDTLRILVATDCHLGYLEKDEVRRNDSFNAFDEICSIASQRQVFAQSSLPFSAVPLHLYVFDC